MLHKLDKEVRFTRGIGKLHNLSAVREHYLRTDISCKVAACRLCANHDHQNASKGLLDSKLLHYAIPDADALCKFLEIFEHTSISGCILLQTALSHVRSKGGRKRYDRVKGLLGNLEKNFVVFSNEFYYETYSSREKDETYLRWQERLVYQSAVWYTHHLQYSNLDPLLVLVTTNPEDYAGFGRVNGLVVETVEGYLKTCWPELVDLHASLQSLMESLRQETQSLSSEHFSKYLSHEAIKEGLKKGLLKSGRLRVSDFHPRDEATVSLQQSDGLDGNEHSDIFIPGKNYRNRAIHGDLVAVQILPPSEWHSRRNTLPPEDGEGSSEKSEACEGVCSGRVVKVIERSSRAYVVSIDESYQSKQATKSERILVVPYDRKIPKIRISTRQADELRNHRIQVQIDSWPEDSNYPNGHFLQSIGPIGELETETKVILLEHELSSDAFSKVILSELPDPSKWQVGEDEVIKRRDLRQSHLVLSIDPKGCEDVDDTLSVRKVKHGNLELGVHIADVAHFVRPGSVTDREAARRSSTTYLADRRYDMLPATLSANLCSLLSNVDRYAVSVLWTLDSSYQVKKVWFGRTIVRSRYKLTYETAQDLFDGLPYEDVMENISELKDLKASLGMEELKKRVEELRQSIQTVVSIARVLQRRRGGLELEGVEVRVSVDSKDKTKVNDLLSKQPLEMHEVIAECMIFANNWVATKIQEDFPTSALLRHHPAPPPERLARVVECARKRGIHLSIDSNKSLAVSLEKAVDPSDPDFNKVLNTLVIRAMVQARYFSSGSLGRDRYHHYGLDLDLYTHFTSPIRRYADLVVHRLLLAAVGDPSEKKDSLPSNKMLQELCDHMNKKHRATQLAQQASVELFQGMYFSVDAEDSPKGRRQEVEAVVVGVRANGIIVLDTRFGLQGPVYFKDKNGLVAQQDPHNPTQVIFDAGSLKLNDDDSVTVTSAGGSSYSIGMFDHVRVQVTSKVSHAHGYSISLQLLSCGRVPPQLHCEAHSGGKRELMQTVREEKGSVAVVMSEVEDGVLQSYRQSDSDTSLYCIFQRLHRLALSPDHD